MSGMFIVLMLAHLSYAHSGISKRNPEWPDWKACAVAFLGLLFTLGLGLAAEAVVRFVIAWGFP